jgi:hypothetical protein
MKENIGKKTWAGPGVACIAHRNWKQKMKSSWVNPGVDADVTGSAAVGKSPTISEHDISGGKPDRCERVERGVMFKT